MKLGTENRKQLMVAGVLGAVLLLVVAYELTSFSSTNASTATTSLANVPAPVAPGSARPAPRLGEHDGGIEPHTPSRPAISAPDDALPLAGVRVLDLTAWWAGPI